MEQQSERIDYGSLRAMIENNTDYSESFKKLLIETAIRPYEIHDSLKYGEGVNWASLSNKDRLNLASEAEWSCRAYFPDIKNPVYAPDQVVEVRNPIGLSETYSKEKIQKNFSAILGLASRIPERFYQEDGCSYKNIVVDRDSGRWTDEGDYISATFTGVCVAAGLLEYVNNPPSSYEEYQTRQNPTLVRATPGFRQYMQPYSQSAERPGKEEYLKYMQMMNEGILAPPTV